MIEAMLEYTFVVFLILLYKKEAILFASVEIACIFSVILEVDLNSMSMLYSIHKLSVIKLFVEVIDYPLILSIFTRLLSKINTVFIFFQDGLGDID